MYLASQLSTKYEVTLIDPEGQLGGIQYDDQYPRHGLFPITEVPEGLSGLFQPVSIPTAFDNFIRAFKLPVDDWVLKSIGSDTMIGQRESFDSNGLDIYSILQRRLGNEYLEEILTKFVEVVLGRPLTDTSPRIVFQLVRKFLEFNPNEYLPEGGYTSISNILLGTNKIDYLVEPIDLDSIESRFDLVLWGTNPLQVYQKYYFESVRPFVEQFGKTVQTPCNSCGTSHEEVDAMDLYKSTINLEEIFTYASAQAVKPSQDVPLIATRVINTSDAYECVNYDVISTNKAGVIGYVCEQGIPVYPVSTEFDSLLKFELPSHIKFVNSIANYCVPDLTQDLKNVELVVENVSAILSK